MTYKNKAWLDLEDVSSDEAGSAVDLDDYLVELCEKVAEHIEDVLLGIKRVESLLTVLYATSPSTPPNKSPSATLSETSQSFSQQ